MKFRGKEFSEYTIDELHSIDWELNSQEAKWLKAMEHPKFGGDPNYDKRKVISPVPTMNPAFVGIREAVKAEINSRKENGNG